jgi:teichuronic acid biosynthesis glycosyltransferase TuaC
MKILIVCSGNSRYTSPFIFEQAEAIKQLGADIVFFPVNGKGIFGYLKNLREIRKVIKSDKIDLIHAHYGLSGLLANLQRKLPVITTFHGSDINDPLIRPLSVLASMFSRHSIFISKRLAQKAYAKNDFSIIPCGIDFRVFFPMDKQEARVKMNLPLNSKLILFSGSAKNKVKNFPLAKAAANLLNDLRLIELRGYSRAEVNLLMNACDVALMTSFNEGSPQFIKEAMACNIPVVSVDVGDVAERISLQDGCFITDRYPVHIAKAIESAIAFGRKTNCRESILNLNNDVIARQIYDLYVLVSKRREN